MTPRNHPLDSLKSQNYEVSERISLESTASLVVGHFEAEFPRLLIR
jgi:hypothetical protein